MEFCIIVGHTKHKYALTLATWFHSRAKIPQLHIMLLMKDHIAMHTILFKLIMALFLVP